MHDAPRASILNAAALGLWAGALAMTGVSAALIFPTMKALDPSLPLYAAHPQDHWMIAAGDVAARQFRVLGIVEAVLALVAVASMLVIMATKAARGRVSTIVRAAMVIVAGALLCGQSLLLQPRMDRNLSAYRLAAREGDGAAAATAKAAFDADHPLASGLMQARLGAVVLGAVACVWWATPRRSPYDPRRSGDVR